MSQRKNTKKRLTWKKENSGFSSVWRCVEYPNLVISQGIVDPGLNGETDAYSLSNTVTEDSAYFDSLKAAKAYARKML